MALTYRKLATYINDHLTDEQKDMDVTVSVGDEYYQVYNGDFTDKENGILDDGHPYLTTESDQTPT
jgi:hypothetical protein